MAKNSKFKNFIRLIGSAVKKLERDHIRVYAAQASFFMTISVLPCIMLAISILGYILPSYISKIETVWNYITAGFYSMIENVLGEIERGASIPVLSITALAMLWAASGGIRGLSEGIRWAYGGKEIKNPLVHSWLFSFIYTLIFIILLAAILVILVFGNILAGYIPESMATANTLLGLRGIIFLVILTFIFMLAYRSFSRSRLKFTKHFLGAAFSAVGWLVYSWAFSLYIEHFANYSYIYGSLTAIVLFMLWLYMCMMILLIGAEINAYLSGINQGSN